MPKKSYAFGHIHQPALFKSTELAEGVRNRLDQLDEIYNTAMTKLKAVTTSGEFTTRGQEKAVAELTVELRRELDDWKVVLRKYADNARQVRESMEPKRHRRDDIAWQLELREIRDYVRTLDPVDQEAFYRQAADEGHDQILEAIEFSPIPFRFATQGLVDKISLVRLERQYPEQAAKLGDLRVAQETASSALKSVQAELSKQGVEVAGDPLSDALAA